MGGGKVEEGKLCLIASTKVQVNLSSSFSQTMEVSLSLTICKV